MSPLKLEHVVARAMADLRTERKWTQSDLAHHMRVMGVRWTPNKVAQLETLRGKLGLFEIVALTWLFEVPIGRLMAGTEDVEAPDGLTVFPLEQVRKAVVGDNSVQEQSRSQAQRAHKDSEELKKVARGLGISPTVLSYIARRLWDHDFFVERDRRVGDLSAVSKRSAQAKRGHATRALIAEVGAYIEKNGLEQIVEELVDRSNRRREEALRRLKAIADDQANSQTLNSLIEDIFGEGGPGAHPLLGEAGVERMQEALRRVIDSSSDGEVPTLGDLMDALPRERPVAGDSGWGDENTHINALAITLAEFSRRQSKQKQQEEEKDSHPDDD